MLCWYTSDGWLFWGPVCLSLALHRLFEKLDIFKGMFYALVIAVLTYAVPILLQMPYFEPGRFIYSCEQPLGSSYVGGWCIDLYIDSA